MQDLRSIPDETPVHYQDPLYLEEQESRRQLLGELGRVKAQRWEARDIPQGMLRAIMFPLSPAYSTLPATQQHESETEDKELWSDSQVSPEPLPRRPLSRSQSWQAAKKVTSSKEVAWGGNMVAWG